MRFAITLLVLVLVACNKEGPGPIQRAGAWVDNTAQKTGQAAENAGTGIADAFKGQDGGAPPPPAASTTP